MRLDNFKIVFLEQQAIGTLYVWANPFTQLRAPKLFNLRTDPFERADFQSNQYYEWVMAHEYLIEVAQFEAREALATFDDFPMRQRPASFSLSNVVDKLSSGVGSH
jgi:arylsulfatase